MIVSIGHPMSMTIIASRPGTRMRIGSIWTPENIVIVLARRASLHRYTELLKSSPWARPASTRWTSWTAGAVASAPWFRRLWSWAMRWLGCQIHVIHLVSTAEATKFIQNRRSSWWLYRRLLRVLVLIRCIWCIWLRCWRISRVILTIVMLIVIIRKGKALNFWLVFAVSTEIVKWNCNFNESDDVIYFFFGSIIFQRLSTSWSLAANFFSLHNEMKTTVDWQQRNHNN